MAEKLSVKGLTVCTPEFYEVAKKGAEQYAQQSKVDAIIDQICDLEYLTKEQANELAAMLGFA